MSKYEEQYKKLLKKVLTKGIERNDRTGVGSYSLFDLSLSVKVNKRFPILTGRQMFPKTFNTEFLWLANGETNVARFKANNVKIWDSWADENGELGPVYGYQMRNWNGEGHDQLKNVIESIIKTPDSRRHIISLWNVGQLDLMALPPCYLYFQFFVNKDNKLDMFVVQRSGDMFLGIPYDVCLFSKILLHVASNTGYVANELSLKIVDAHIYKNQIEAIHEYLKQPTFKLPKFHQFNSIDTELIDYKHGPRITAPVAV